MFRKYILLLLPAAGYIRSMHKQDKTYTLQIHEFKQTVKLVDVSPTTRIAYLDFLSDIPLIWACARELRSKLKELKPSTLVAPATGAIPLCFATAHLLNAKMVILRKDSRGYMQGTHSTPVSSVAALSSEQLLIEDRYIPLLQDGPVVLLDSVTTSGSTFKAMNSLMRTIGVKVAAQAVAFIEGDQVVPDNFIHVGRLPIFTSDPEHE